MNDCSKITYLEDVGINLETPKISLQKIQEEPFGETTPKSLSTRPKRTKSYDKKMSEESKEKPLNHLVSLFSYSNL